MAEELDILKIIAENPSISQRKIAEQTNISLGQVNFLIKKCVKKGLVKIEGQTAKSIRYNLTPKGIAEKAVKTLEYVKLSYKAVSALTDKIETLCKVYSQEGVQIYVCGPEDEMMQILKLVLDGNHIPWRNWETGGKYIKEKNLPDDIQDVVLYWEVELQEELMKSNVKAINVLE